MTTESRDAGKNIMERLREVATHDWRVSFLAHTSDTASMAMQAIYELRKQRDEAQQACRAMAREIERMKGVQVKTEADTTIEVDGDGSGSWVARSIGS